MDPIDKRLHTEFTVYDFDEIDTTTTFGEPYVSIEGVTSLDLASDEEIQAFVHSFMNSWDEAMELFESDEDVLIEWSAMTSTIDKDNKNFVWTECTSLFITEIDADVRRRFGHFLRHFYEDTMHQYGNLVVDTVTSLTFHPEHDLEDILIKYQAKTFLPEHDLSIRHPNGLMINLDGKYR